MSRAVALVADAGERAGLGHLARCSAIAAALRARGTAVECHAYGAAAPIELDGIEWAPLTAEPDASVLVLDSYVMDEPEAAGLAERFALVFVHDLAAPPPGTQLVVSVGGAEGDEVLAGLAYAPLRRSYWGLPPRSVADRVRSVLVTTGGGVIPGSEAGAAGAARAALPPEVAVRVVRGPAAAFDAPDGVEVIEAPPSLLEELLRADLVVSAAGQTALEAAATGAPCVALPLVENQRGNARALEAAGAAVVTDDPEEEVRRLAGDAAGRSELARRAQAAVDGYGALRIAFRIERLLS